MKPVKSKKKGADQSLEGQLSFFDIAHFQPSNAPSPANDEEDHGLDDWIDLDDWFRDMPPQDLVDVDEVAPELKQSLLSTSLASSSTSTTKDPGWDYRKQEEPEGFKEHRYYYDDGSLWMLGYTFNKRFHHESLPSLTYFTPCGQVISELYYSHGKKHREDGPAEIYYDLKAEKKTEAYYLNDRHIQPQDFLKSKKEPAIKSHAPKI